MMDLDSDSSSEEDSNYKNQKKISMKKLKNFGDKPTGFKMGKI